MRAGTRCTTFVKLPVALSGGSRANFAPVAALKLSTMPFAWQPPYASTSSSAGCPTLRSESCVSLKFAVTHTPVSDTIVADTGVFITANFKETQLADIRVGQPAEIEVDAYHGATATACVESVSAATGSKFALLPPDNATGNFTKVVQRIPVRLKVKQGLGPDRPLRPGMSATVHVETKEPAGKC